MSGRPGPTRPTLARLSRDHVRAVEQLVAERGKGRALELLGTSDTMLDRILGPGVLTPAAAARLVGRLEELR